MLTSDQLTAIDQHLRGHLHERPWWQQKVFIAEITDHYIHAISELMKQGNTFDMALARVYDNFGRQNGLKQMELTYWKLSARELRRKVLHNMLSRFSFPLVFITIPLIGFFLLIRFEFAEVFSSPFGSMSYTFFQSSLFGIAILSLLTALLKKYFRYAGRFQSIAQKIVTPLRNVTNYLLVAFNLEMFSSPLFIGEASPYVATLFYTISVLLFVGYKKAIKDHTILPHVGY